MLFYFIWVRVEKSFKALKEHLKEKVLADEQMLGGDLFQSLEVMTKP